MGLCVNILPLRFSMTRVEKYRSYREEISNMKFENFNKKHEAAKQVDTFHGNINYDKVMVVHEMFDESDEKSTKKRSFYI